MNAVIEGADTPGRKYWIQGDTLPTHSPFGASSAHRWTKCPGSIKAQEGLPDEPSSYAQEGTAGHSLAAWCLANECDAPSPGYWDGVELDNSVIEAVQLYLDTIRADRAKHGGSLMVETRFHLEALHLLFYGTADCVRIGTDGTLTVYDLKLGRGKVVEVADEDGRPNVQLAYYARGAVHELGASEIFRTGKVELVIIQPRAPHKDGPVRRWLGPISWIIDVGRFLVRAAAECEKPDAPLVPGDHCTFCKAAPTCPALRTFVSDLVQLDWDDGLGTAFIPDPEEADLGRVLIMIEDFIEPWIRAVRGRVRHLAAAPAGVPGWKLVDRQSRRQWVDEEMAIVSLKRDFRLDDDDIYDRKLLSPARVEKLLPPASRTGTLFKGLSQSALSGSSLVRADNPKPERKPVQREFDDGFTDDYDEA